MLRRVLLVAVAIAVALSVAVWSGAAQAGTVFVVTGRGFGHGVGMSQYGAYGFAQQGLTYNKILAHYYPGTQLVKTSVSSLRVHLAHARETVSVGSHARFRLVDALGRSLSLDAGNYVLGRDLQLTVNGTEVRPSSPVRAVPGALPLAFAGRPYRGELLVTATPSLTVMNSVRLEDYLRGVVPMEMPATWALEALKAQAVAARSYALATRRQTGRALELEAGASDQVYGGIAAEDNRTDAAIVTTRGQVLFYAGQPAATLFFSSSGGRTAAATDVWPERDLVPYLTSVDDPYDSISPYHEWGPLRLTDRDLVRHLSTRAPRGLRDATYTVTRSGRVGSVTLVGASDASTTVNGATFASLLGLRSTWFSVSVLRLETLQETNPGRGFTLSGTVRGFRNVRLEQRTERGWMLVMGIAPEPDGSFRAVVSPVGPTTYRLVAPGVVGPAVRIALPGA